MKKYVKPEVKFEKITLTENIADGCWNQATGNKTGMWWYDIRGDKYPAMQILVSGGSCGQGNGPNKATYGGVIVDGVTYTDPLNEYYRFGQNAFNYGSSVHGNGIYSDNPNFPS